MVTLTELIKEQIYEAFVMFYCGMGCAICYEIYSVFVKNGAIEKILSPNKGYKKTTRAIAEILFWIFAAMITTKFLYVSCQGKISIHIIVAFALGAILWKNIFYGIIGEHYVQKKKEKKQGL